MQSPAQALQPAVRVTTTTTVPDIEGAIRFPVALTEDDCAYVLDNFGDCRSGCSRLHEGVDIMGDVGLPIVTPTSGVLVQKYEDRGLTYGAGHGWTVHAERLDVTYRFFHLDSHEEGLEVGDEVEAGQVIGYLGNTGTSGVPRGDNYHLHFEFRPGDRAIDAFDLLSRNSLAAFAGENDWCSPRLEPPDDPPDDPDDPGDGSTTTSTTTTTTVPDPG
ncbi:MAG: M23 family metallopeptidase [Actinomycetota bacterium]